jgi:hypothetical protein
MRDRAGEGNVLRDERRVKVMDEGEEERYRAGDGYVAIAA